MKQGELAEPYSVLDVAEVEAGGGVASCFTFFFAPFFLFLALGKIASNDYRDEN